MPFAQPKVYYDLLIKPMLDRFNANPTAYDLAFATCVALDNMGDLYAKEQGLTEGVARERITAAIPDFRKIVVIANAFKHGEVNHKRHGIYVGTRAEHAVVDDGAAFSDGSYFSDGTSFSDAEPTVVMKFPNGEICDVNHLCGAVARALPKLFNFDRPEPVRRGRKYTKESEIED